MKRKFLLLSCFSLAFTVSGWSQHKLTKIWETPDSIINMPESVLPYGKFLYVSELGNSATEKDGIGGVIKMDTKGQIIKKDFVSGLNAPKGQAIFGNKFYVADLDQIVEIDLKSGKLLKKHAVEGAVFLNDVTVSGNGIVYVSDTRTNKIHKLENGVVSTYLENINKANGVRVVGNYLYIAAGQNLLKVNSEKQMTLVAKLPQDGDGIEPIGNGDFLFSSWSGYIYYVDADGRFQLLLDTHNEKKNTADIGYNQETGTLYVPTFNRKSVEAYRLE
ncbi:ATP-binding protein [Pedobacter sp. HMF7647]|uniref:ATP-binding protein n=1 Tax=Hufsiella arboris TaxID=2695275 RepID=A0A7K1Y6I4_9SPHI|nr:ATP-binding protein [Hufsiella arboris]MXV50184.1 ATP-binding protein [Hufsiella arboris]